MKRAIKKRFLKVVYKTYPGYLLTVAIVTPFMWVYKTWVEFKTEDWSEIKDLFKRKTYLEEKEYLKNL